MQAMSDKNRTNQQKELPVNNQGTEFDWLVYSDATMAGLAALIPVPYVDSIVEGFFRQRMLKTIAQRNRIQLHPHARQIITESQSSLLAMVGGCLTWPFTLAIGLAIRLSRKLVYALSVKKAVDSLSYYWQRAFLLDHMAKQGYLSDIQKVEPATRTLNQVLKRHSVSPLNTLALQILGTSTKLVRSLPRRWWKRDTGEVTALRPKEIMQARWQEYSDYFENLRAEYESTFASGL